MAAAEFRTDIWTDRSVIVADGRANRPQTVAKSSDRMSDSITSDDQFEMDQDPFLEGREFNTPSERLALRQAGTLADESGWLLRVVANRFPAVTAITAPDPVAAKGIHDVVIECPDFRRCWLNFSAIEVSRVLVAWQLRLSQLVRVPELKSIQVFRNQGSTAGASLGHSHSQIISLTRIPQLNEKRLQNSDRFYEWRSNEIADGRRIIAAEDMLVVCPAASWVKGQIRICPNLACHALDVPFHQLPTEAVLDLARLLQQCIALVQTVLPKAGFNVVLNQPPIRHLEAFPWSIDIMPRTASFAGFELSCDIPIITMAPETAAAEYRSVWKAYSQPSQADQESLSDICPSEFSWQPSQT